MNDIKGWETLFSHFRPDLVSKALGTNFVEFTSPFSVTGLVRCTDKELYFLAIISAFQGKGNFLEFLNHAKELADKIIFLHVWSEGLESTLNQNGFRQTVEQIDKEKVEAYTWKKSR